MVQTRRKKAAAAQDGAVNENKAEPPAPQPQTPTKRGRRGRPPKTKPEVSTPSTSGSTDASNIEKTTDDAPDMKPVLECEPSNSAPSITNEADSFLEKEDVDQPAPSNRRVKKEIPSPEKPKSALVPPPPLSSKRRTTIKIKIKQEPAESVSDPRPETPKELIAKQDEVTMRASLSPPHPEDPQPSSTVAAVDEQATEIKKESEPVEEKEEPNLCTFSQPPVKNEPETTATEQQDSETQSPQQDVSTTSETSVPLFGANKLIEDSTNDSESMDIADSDSDSGEGTCVEADVTRATSSMSGTTPVPNESATREIHVDVEQSFTNKPPGLPSWERTEEKQPENPLSSPVRRPRIHFLHPAYQSFASDQAHTSPLPPPPPEPAPLKETENGFSMGFKPMAFKSKVGLKTNALMNPSALDASPRSTASTAPPAPPLGPPTSEFPIASGFPLKRNSNFGVSASVLPPPKMVDLPKLSFFNMHPPTEAVSEENDSPSEEHGEKKHPKTAPSVVVTPTTPKLSEVEILALKAKAEKVAQDIARRHHAADKQKEERDDHERRREERERRHKKADEERMEQSKLRQKEDDERRNRDRERDAMRRKERDESRKEEERLQAQRELERKQREEESKIREQERKAREEERKIKEEGKRMKEEDMKVPPYECITECKFLTRNANKKKTDSLICDCHRVGGNCSDGECVNRAMLTECPSSCPAKCKNQRFAKRKYASVEAFHTGTAKGCGLRALKDIKKGRFIIEYVGEVVERDDYEKRKQRYAADKKHKHHYLCDTGVYTIDATVYGNPSRFVNHSCDPNAICEKWSVPRTPGDINRIGFFAKRNIKAGEEITFDYQFVNYGRDAQQCFCGSSNCTGWIGEKPDEFSSDEEDDDETGPSRHVNIDEDEDERLDEQMYGLSPCERTKLLHDAVNSLTIRHRKHARKVITIASKMTDHGQRMWLVDSLFRSDLDLISRLYYADEGVGALITEWLAADDFSLANLKLVQMCISCLQNDSFSNYRRSDRLFAEVIDRWATASYQEWMDIHVVTDALVTSICEPSAEYSSVEDATHNEIVMNIQRCKEMAVRLKNHLGAITFKIPKKIRDQEPKESEGKTQSSNSYHSNESNRNGAVSPPYQRHHHSSSNNERESHPRFFNNGNDVLQYRFAGYHGNNYKENYQRRLSYRESYRDRRRPGRRSRSRSRSSSPQMYKRRKLEERESRNRSPYERRAVSPGARTPGSTASGERTTNKTVAKMHALSDSSSGSVHAPATSDGRGPSTPHLGAYPNPHDPAGHPVVPVGYAIPGYEAYGMYDPTGMYMYHHGTGYYPPTYHQHGQQALTIETLPSIEKLDELYGSASLEQLTERLEKAQKEIERLQSHIARKRAEEEAAAAARLKAEEEARRLEALNAVKYVWARAKSDTGETYYYNKVTKETQWSPPSAEQGLLDPNDRASPDTTVAVSEEQKPVVAEVKVEDVDNEKVKVEPAEEQTTVQRTEEPLPQKSSRDRDREHDRDRDRREGSRHRDSSHRHENLTREERRTRDFKSDLEKVIRSIVKSAVRNIRDATHDKTTWLIKTVAKEMYKRESMQPGFDFRFTDITERKVRNYTKSLIERKLKSDDLWKGYSDGR